MSDREKGLSKAVSEALPNAKHSHCCQYITANIQSRFGIICRKLFWSAAYARTKAEFDTAIDSILKRVRLQQYIYVQFQQKPGLLMPFHSLVMGILPQILLRV
jgi:hypothetical protein